MSKVKAPVPALLTETAEQMATRLRAELETRIRAELAQEQAAKAEREKMEAELLPYLKRIEKVRKTGPAGFAWARWTVSGLAAIYQAGGLTLCDPSEDYKVAEAMYRRHLANKAEKDE